MKKIQLTIIVFILIAGFTNAQTADDKWSAGVFQGKNMYNGDLGSNITKLHNGFYVFAGLSVSRYLTSSFDLGLEGSFGRYGFIKNTYEKFQGNKSEGSLLLKYKFANGYILDEDVKLAPFIAIGGGIAGYSRGIEKDGYDMLLPIGGGLKYRLNDMLAVQYQALYNFTDNDIRDGVVADKNDHFLEHSLGLIINFSCGPKDIDGDGIVNKLDLCPNVAGISAFNGCPDKDGDGIQDSKDKCPNVKGIAQFNGCPDTDADGIQDSEDNCPNVKGIAQFKGCPDTDGDGIQDSEDKCPTVKGIAQFNGCPDTDGDGIEDSKDQCPTEKGTAALKGCPDSDNDGIADKNDKCPKVFGVIANNGCPEIKEETKKIFEQALTGIQFQTGKDIIQKTSYPILNQVVKVMTDNPNYNLEINGHTDNMGDPAKNLDLSKRRSEAVKKYLSDKGVSANRMTAKGFGPDVPIADNATSAGRAKNRRVEFKVKF